MFNEDFYPTPPEVIDRMLDPLYDKETADYIRSRYLPYRKILEPSAGKGDIVKHLIEKYRVHKTNIYCIELETDLRYILGGLGVKIIDSDFLTYNEGYLFDLIIMNPPFSNGTDHLLKAWEVLYKGDIVCLLNAQTILNPYSANRTVLMNLIESYGRYEIVGPVFHNSERPTDVEVAIVWLHKEMPSKDYFENLMYEPEYDELETNFDGNFLATNDVISAIVAQFNAATKVLAERHKLTKKYQYLVKDVVRLGEGELDDVTRSSDTLNKLVDDLKRDFWKYVFEKTQLGRKTTSSFQKTFFEFQENHSTMAFNVKNIMNVLEQFYFNLDEILINSIVDIFDKCTSYHAKNKIHSEGWVTNKFYKVPDKIIIPNGVEYMKKPKLWTLNSRAQEFYRDLDKVMCYLTGINYEDITKLEDVVKHRTLFLNDNRKNPSLYLEKIRSDFFEVRFFMKNTIHITFLDSLALENFNRVAAHNKKWIGDGS